MTHPYLDARHSVEDRANDLLARMTFDEKAAQMHALWLLLSDDGNRRPRQGMNNARIVEPGERK